MVVPITRDDDEQTHTRLTIEPLLHPGDGSAWAFSGTGYDKIVEPWAAEQHIPPIKRNEGFGDIESWVEYVRAFAPTNDWSLLTWNEHGLSAVLDYHLEPAQPGRCQWTASHPFVHSIQWNAWKAVANGQPKGQRQVIEAFEDLAEDIESPDQATLVEMLRKLRATHSAKAEAELRPDGTMKVTYTKNQTIEVGSVELPPQITIAIPVLKGHTYMNDDGKQVPVVYRLPVRLRVSVNDDAQPVFRLSMPTAERVLEAVYADRVQAAQVLLGTDHTLLRATG